MLKAQSTQFSINEHGRVLYQAKLGSPLPGEAVAVLKKSSQALAPDVEILEVGLAHGDAPEVQAFLSQWLETHIGQILEPLVALKTIQESVPEPVQAIYNRVYEAMGVVQRADLESDIAKLDADTRRLLREKRIKLGPILVFQPDLNKPAAIKLKAVLWSLFHEKPLPASLPKEGIVSFALPDEAIDQAYYQVIGYPVYADRAVRIDMLDRVVNAVYDSASNGKFQAQHSMAEWLGCGTEDLYKILEAMGHKKAFDPGPGAEKTEGEEKPPLATFYLKKGRASSSASVKANNKKPAKPKAKSKKPKKPQGPKVIQSGPKSMPEDSPFAVLAQLKKD